MSEIDFANPIYFVPTVSSESVDSCVYKLNTILYLDDDVCLCVAVPFISEDNLSPRHIADRKILFSIPDVQTLTIDDENLLITSDLEEAQSYLSY